MKTYFIGTLLSNIARDSLVKGLAEAEEVWPQLHWIAPEKLHVTLYYIGELPEKKRAALSQALRQIAAAQKYLNLYFSQLEVLEHDSVQHLIVRLAKSQALSNLAHLLRTKLDEILERDKRQPFLPHVTVAKKVDLKSKEMPHFEVTQRFEITELELIEVDNSVQPSTYKILEEFPLVSDKKSDDDD